MSIGVNDIILLLGAGASKDAGIPTSWDMIKEIEELILEDPEWVPYKELYWYIKSAIYYADGISGAFDSKVPYNIERLVNALSELAQKEEHTIYPFIGNWNIKLIEVANIDFQKIKEFKDLIVKRLKVKWITRPDYSRASYFEKLSELHHDHTFPLRVFTLNYDLCIERNIDKRHVHRGFQLLMPDRKWDWKLFEDSAIDDNFPEAHIILYKLHGSIDWTRDNAGNLIYLDESSQIDDDKLAIIFGTNYKLQYVDPFLFYAYEFRKFSLEAKAIICVGYGFADEHINGMIKQALQSDHRKKLICIRPFDYEDKEITEEEICRWRSSIKADFGISSDDQIVILNRSAKKYFQTEFTTANLTELLPETDETLPF